MRPAEKGSNNILCSSHNGRRKKKRKGSKGLIILPRPVSFERAKKRFLRRLQPSLRLWPCSGRVWTAHVELFALILIKKLFVSLSTSNDGFIPHHFASSRPLINYEIPLRKFFHFIHFSRARPLFSSGSDDKTHFPLRESSLGVIRPKDNPSPRPCVWQINIR